MFDWDSRPAEVLAWASLDEPVYPGEFFAVGPVGGGCGLELNRWIQPGDIVELEASSSPERHRRGCTGPAHVPHRRHVNWAQPGRTRGLRDRRCYLRGSGGHFDY
jgi:hypothetical protein